MKVFQAGKIYIRKHKWWSLAVVGTKIVCLKQTKSGEFLCYCFKQKGLITLQHRDVVLFEEL